MERLTRKHFRPGNSVKLIKENLLIAMYDKLYEYETLEEQGLLLKPPCKIGDDVYFIPSKANYHLNILHGYEENNRVYHQKVANIVFTPRGWYIKCDKDMDYGTGNILVDIFFKKTWFLSEAEAEKALEEMKKMEK